MRRAALLALTIACMPGASPAQVSTNQHALDRLGPVAKPHAHTSRPAHAPARTRTHPHSQPASTAARVGRPPAIPLHPPPPPVIAPPALRVALHPPPPPPAVPVDATATGVATPIRNGVRVTFGAASAAVNAGTDEALHGIAARLKAEPNMVVDIDAYAAGSEDDPSSPRRLSLARALAGRAVLINDGIVSTRIYARALGTAAAPGTDTEPQGPADRADLVVRNSDNRDGGSPPVKATSR